ncbi:MAG: hypothetical protein ACRENP_24805 [Longimicrobiales bacterium]
MHASSGRYRHAAIVLVTLLSSWTSTSCSIFTGPDRDGRGFEVWLIDQSDSRGVNYGGTLYVYDSDDLDADDPASVTPRERIDLAGEIGTLCNTATGANPVRPHMLVFNREQTHAILSFVASGHVALIDAKTRRPVGCVRTSQSATGRQAHAAFPAPNGTFVVIANQNGKRLERIDVDFRAGTFTLNPAATLDLTTCATPSGTPCQAPDLRPDNAPICPIVEATSRYAFVTLRGGGLLVVDARKTPMEVVADYDKATVKGNGCGGAQVGPHMYVNSGGRPGNLSHLDLFGFDVYRFPVFGYTDATKPRPQLLFSSPGEHDSHGMVNVRNAHVWVMDRHANLAEVISTATGQRVNTVPLAGPLSSDPAPDLVDVSPAGGFLFVALRGPTPLSGDPHIATGNSPGLGVIALNRQGSDGELVAILRISNVDATGVERADAHAVRVRQK